jgi:ribosomal protein L17
VEAQARATAKAVVRSATARALRDALKPGPSEGESAEEQIFKSAQSKEERMRNIISSLVTLASASGVSQERALFMEVAKNEVQTIIDKMNTRGGAPLQLPHPALPGAVLGQLLLLPASCRSTPAVLTAVPESEEQTFDAGAPLPSIVAHIEAVKNKRS